MIHRLVKCLARNGCIQPGQEEIVAFGLNEGIHSIMGAAVAILLGCFLGIGGQALIFLAAFIPLRIYAGGYHAQSRKACAFLSLLLILAVFVLLDTWRGSATVTFVLGTVSAGIILCLGSTDNRNHRFSSGERRVYSGICRKMVLIEVVVLAAAGMMNCQIVQSPVAAALLLELLLMLVGKVRGAIV